VYSYILTKIADRTKKIPPPETTDYSKFLHPCEGEKCPAYKQCAAGHRIIDSRINICASMRKRFKTKKIPPVVKKTPEEVMVEKLIKETASPA
jgi:hypothetical protein